MSEHNLNSTSTTHSSQPTSSSLTDFPSNSVAPKIDLTRTDNADNKRTNEAAFHNEEVSEAKSALRNTFTSNYPSESSENRTQKSEEQTGNVPDIFSDKKPIQEDNSNRDEKLPENNDETYQSSLEVHTPVILVSGTAGQEVQPEYGINNISVVVMTSDAFTTFNPVNTDDASLLDKPIIEEVKADEPANSVSEECKTSPIVYIEFPPEQEEQIPSAVEVEQNPEEGDGDGGTVDGEEGAEDGLKGPDGDHKQGPIVTEPAVDEVEAAEYSVQTIEVTTVILTPVGMEEKGVGGKHVQVPMGFPTPLIRLMQHQPRQLETFESDDLAEALSAGSVLSGVSDALTATTVDESGSAESLAKSDADPQNAEASEDVANIKALADLIDSSSRSCSYNQGYIKRQLIYSCRTCILDVMDPAGICLGCALNCHDEHDLVPMLTRRNFRCDCGNSKFGPRKCQLIADKDGENAKNVYNDNFHGVVCTCRKSLVGTKTSSGNLSEVGNGTTVNPAAADEDIVQCRVCEEQYHASHIGVNEEDFGEEWEGEMVCRGCLNDHDFLRYYQADLNDPEALVPEAGQACTLAALKKTFGEQQSASRPYVFSGSWWENLCRCSDCQDMYKKQKVDFLLDSDDTFASYEEREGTKEMENVQRAAAMTPEEIFAQICEGFDSITQVELAHWFNNLREVFVTFLQDKLQQGQQTITDTDIEEFFATFSSLQEDREEDDCDLI